MLLRTLLFVVAVLHGSRFCLTVAVFYGIFFFFSSRRRHTRSDRDWSSDVCSSDLPAAGRCIRRTAYGSSRGPHPQRPSFRPASAADFADRRSAAPYRRRSVPAPGERDRKSVV